MNDLICAKLKEIVNFQDIIKTNELNYKSNIEKFIVLVNILYLLLFLRDIHKRYLSLEDAVVEQSNFEAKFKNLDASKKQLKRTFFKIT